MFPRVNGRSASGRSERRAAGHIPGALQVEEPERRSAVEKLKAVITAVIEVECGG